MAAAVVQVRVQSDVLPLPWFALCRFWLPLMPQLLRDSTLSVPYPTSAVVVRASLSPRGLSTYLQAVQLPYGF